jgi:F-type H+-transporting ATPase subunit epsilon
MKTLTLRIATLEKLVFDGAVKSVTLPGSAGVLTILPNHMPLITQLSLGEITARSENDEFYLVISSGMVEVQSQRVLVLADEVERAEELDEERANEARIRAEQIMREKREDKVTFADAEAELQKSLLRLKIIQKLKRRKRLIPH